MKVNQTNDFYNSIFYLKQTWGKLIMRLIFPFLLLILVAFLSSNKPVYNSNFPPETKDTIFVYDTIYLHDTTYIYDTVFEDVNDFDTLKQLKTYLKSNPEFLQDLFLESNSNPFYNKKFNSVFSIEYNFSAIYSNQIFTDDNIYSEYIEKNKNALSPLPGFSSGFNFNYYNKNKFISSGLNFTVLKNSFNNLSTEYYVEFVDYYQHFQNETIRIDTILFINIDTLLATGDTVYQIYQDTNHIFTLDSTLIKIPDTTETKFQDKAVNKFIYLEIPLIIGKTYKYQNFTLSPEIGIITGMLLNTSGKLISINDINTSEPIKPKSDVAFINLSAHFGLKTEYYISPKINFSVKSYYRFNINSIFSNYPIISKNNIFGLQLGLRYKF
jgi:hypothetical protein